MAKNMVRLRTSILDPGFPIDEFLIRTLCWFDAAKGQGNFRRKK